MADEAPAAAPSTAPSMLEEDAPSAPDAGSPRLLRCICLGCTIIEVDVTRVAAHVLLVWQVAMITIFALWADYDYQTGSPLDMTYTWYSDVTLLVLLGFGYHLAMASRYALTAVGFTLLLVALVVQWALLVNGALAGVAAGTGFPEEIAVALDDLISADLAAAAVLVTFGALVGRVSLLQATVLAILETVFFAANKTLVLDGALGVSDAGGTFSIHMFGAYFGLAVSAALGASPEPASPAADGDDDSEKGSEKGGDGALSATEPVATPPKSRTAELFSMLGTVVLWVYWPSLVACFLDDGSNQMSRAITNTVLALTSSTVVAVALSLELSTEAYAKLRPADVQNATLAGGVAIGASANWAISPGGALGIGAAAGAVAAYASARLGSPWLKATLGVDDACGVHALHGLPSLVGALASIIAAALAAEASFAHGTSQWFYQLAGMLSTLIGAIASGLFTGVVLRCIGATPTGGDESHWVGAPKQFKDV